ncbi:hypothetical protein [Deminuibacter soli]|uniref:hypothetical protein n=1 Tax=Deminuibacter soli TaxID=2291815 RepID=UPI001314259E|nr:hypothetical protein [Deminuibacter soli]
MRKRHHHAVAFAVNGILRQVHLRDIWKQQDIGTVNRYSSKVAAHGVLLLQCSK